MTMMNDFKLGDFEITVRDHGYATYICCSGAGDQPTPAITVRPFLNRIRINFKGHHVALDFRKLTYANSATITEIVFLLHAAAAEAESAEVTYDPQVAFQRSVFGMLEKLQVNANRLRFIQE